MLKIEFEIGSWEFRERRITAKLIDSTDGEVAAGTAFTLEGALSAAIADYQDRYGF